MSLFVLETGAEAALGLEDSVRDPVDFARLSCRSSFRMLLVMSLALGADPELVTINRELVPLRLLLRWRAPELKLLLVDDYGVVLELAGAKLEAHFVQVLKPLTVRPPFRLLLMKLVVGSAAAEALPCRRFEL